LFIGRRTLNVPDTIKSVIDLTCEFEEYGRLVKDKSYFSFPILDACPPDNIDFKEVLDKIARLPKPVYIHCAEGHGRTGMVAAGLLLYEQNAKTIDEAINLIQSVRPKVKLQKAQSAYLRGMGFI
jgi:protein-tyrosine phosphatase